MVNETTKCSASEIWRSSWESLLVTGECSEFQIDGAEHRKARCANSLLVKGMARNGIRDERYVRVDSRGLMWHDRSTIQLVGNLAACDSLVVFFSSKISRCCETSDLRATGLLVQRRLRFTEVVTAPASHVPPPPSLQVEERGTDRLGRSGSSGQYGQPSLCCTLTAQLLYTGMSISVIVSSW